MRWTIVPAPSSDGISPTATPALISATVESPCWEAASNSRRRSDAPPADARTLNADLCVYGATAAGVAAAVAANRLGRTAVLIEHGGAVGGMTAGGLSMIDIGNKRAIGGLSREFYCRCGAHYGVAEEWRFEPRVASAVLADLLAEAGVPLYTRQPLDSVSLEGRRITSIATEAGLLVRARVFVDTSYEGDLLARRRLVHCRARVQPALRRGTQRRPGAPDTPVRPAGGSLCDARRPGQRAAAGDRSGARRATRKWRPPRAGI